jgi:bifunctional non-homologous end joining protein LigD
MHVPDSPTAGQLHSLHGDPAIPPDLVRFREPFDHPDWVFEVKDDGFRALAHITGHHCELRSRNGHVFKHWPQLWEELAHATKAHNAIIDGEIVCLDRQGCSNAQ